MHQKVAQAKASIIQEVDGDSTPDGAASRPESSKMRVRLDDSSQISKDQHHLMSAFSGDSNIIPRHRGLSPERFNGVLTPESDFQVESVNGAQANAYEV